MSDKPSIRMERYKHIHEQSEAYSAELRKDPFYAEEQLTDDPFVIREPLMEDAAELYIQRIIDKYGYFAEGKDDTVFSGDMHITAYYLKNDHSRTDDKLKNYGAASVTWIAMDRKDILEKCL